LTGYNLAGPKNLACFEFTKFWFLRFKRAAQIYGGDFSHLFEGNSVISEIPANAVVENGGMLNMELDCTVTVGINSVRSASLEYSRFEIGLEKFVLISAFNYCS